MIKGFFKKVFISQMNLKVHVLLGTQTRPSMSQGVCCSQSVPSDGTVKLYVTVKVTCLHPAKDAFKSNFLYS